MFGKKPKFPREIIFKLNYFIKFFRNDHSLIKLWQIKLSTLINKEFPQILICVHNNRNSYIVEVEL